MRHLVKGKKLGRNTPHRIATLKALSCSLIKHKQIQTTVAKAKALRQYIEPVITRSKVDNSHNRRQTFSALQDKEAVTILFDEIGPEVADRPGGYTRILKLGFRLGDSAEMALIELVDFSDYEPEKKSAKKKRTRRAGKANKPTDAEQESTETKAEEEKASAVEEKAQAEDTPSEDTSVDEKKAEEKAVEEAPEKKSEAKNEADDTESKDSDDKEEKK